MSSQRGDGDSDTDRDTDRVCYGVIAVDKVNMASDSQNLRKRQKESQDVSSDSLNADEGGHLNQNVSSESASNIPGISDIPGLFRSLCEKIDAAKNETISEIRGELRSEVAGLKETIDGLKAENDQLKQKFEESEGRQQVMADELERLRHTVNSQALAITEIQQYSRSSNLKIYGLNEISSSSTGVETPAETAAQVIKLCKEKLNVDLKEDEIAATHRLGPKKDNKPRSIIIRFVHKTVRNKVLGARKALKRTGIVIVDDLCPTNSSMFHKLRELLGNDVWTLSGKILVKLGKVIKRVDEENFGDILRDITGNREGGLEQEGEMSPPPPPQVQESIRDRGRDRFVETNVRGSEMQRDPRRAGPPDWPRYSPGPQGPQGAWNNAPPPKLRGFGRGRRLWGGGHWGGYGGGTRTWEGYRGMMNPEDY